MNFKRFLLFLVAPLAMVMSSCEPDTPVYTTPAITIADANGAAVTALNFNAEGGEQSFTITATRGWNISKTGDWFAISPSSATNESMEEKTTEVKITVAPNDGEARNETIKVVMEKTEKNIVVSQAGEGQTALGAEIFGDNFDNGTAQENSGWPALDDFVNPTGAAAEGVTYTVANVQARSNSLSNNSHSGYKDEASGNNNAFFRTNGVLTINNINLSAQTSKDYTLTFGCYRSVYEDDDNSFKSSEFHVLLSADGEKWTEVAYTRPADEVSKYGTWNKATATFSLKEKPETLSVRFVSDLASSHRLDDVKFFVGGGGAEVDLANGTTSGGNTGGTTSGAPETLIEATIAEFNAAPVSNDTWYKLTGEITNIAKADYGNFTIKDATAEVYIYGMTNGWVGKNDQSFSAIGLKVGDIVTLGTLRGEYNGQIQGGGNKIPAYYISHVAGEGGETPENPDPETPEQPEQGVATVTEDTITMDFLGIKANGAAELTENNYGEQAHANASTWYTWNVGDYNFAGIKVCAATGDHVGYFQQQGHASDAAKQGEIFNTSAIALKTITIVAANKNASYTPSATLYVGTTERPVSGDAVVATTKESTTEGALTIFTWTYDLSDLNVQYFNFVNNTTGANYYKSFTITYGEGGETPENPEGGEPTDPENPEGGEPTDPENPEGGETPEEPETPVEPETPAVTTLTVQEFLNADEDASVWYQLTGVVKNIVNTTYGNFDLVDETGSVYVYGLTATQVSSNDKSFSTLGLVDGDTVTLMGVRSSHNGTAQVGGPAYYVSHVVNTTPRIVGVSPVTISFVAEGGEKTVTVNTLGEGGVLAATTAAEWLTVNAADGVVTIVAAANEGEAREAEVTVTFGEDSATVTVSQAAYVPAGSEITLGESYSYTFEKTTFSANGTVALGNLSWTLAGDGGYWGYDSQNGKGHQFGSSKAAYKSMTLTTEDYIGGVQTIKIKTSGASDIKGTLVVTVGGVQIGNEITLTKTATEYTLEAEAVLSGAIVLTYTQTSSKAIYINSISIN